MINIKNLDKDNVVPIVWVDNTEELKYKVVEDVI